MIRSRLQRFHGRMSAPFVNAHERFVEREGLLFTLTHESGAEGQGEASPLPGFSRDTLEQCGAELETVRDFPSLFGSPKTVVQAIAEASSALSMPAARHALETALFDLAGKLRGEPVWWLLRAASGGPQHVPSLMPLAAVIPMGEPEATVEQALATVARGVRTLKLKVGRDLTRELETLRSVRRAVSGGVELRLDANRAFGAAQAREALAAFAPLRPELVEEPSDPLVESPVPLARDESLLDEPRADVAVWVLKPMALGGLTRCLELAARARESDIDVIVSHLLDGPVALSAAAALSLAVGAPNRAAGLYPHPGLGAWPERPLPAFTQANLIRRDTPGLG